MKIEKIKNSITEFGFNDPVAIDEKNIIVEGHGRFLALQQLGFKEVEVIKLQHLTENQKKAYRIAHNKITLNSEFDLEKLKVEFENLEINLLELTGFELEEIETEFSELFTEPPIEAEEEITFSDTETPYSRKGDLWLLGEHKLLCGDSTDKQDVKKLLEGEKVDLVIIDPPYNVDYQGKTGEELKIKNDNMKDKEFYDFLFNSYRRLYEVAKDGAGIYVFHADTEGVNFRTAMTEAGWKHSQSCVWVKNSIVLGRQDYQWQHEPILVGWKPTGAHKWYSDRKQSTVWNFDKPLKNDIHPTMKPVQLISYPIKNSSKKLDVIADFFGGGGSTLIACEENMRKARLIELDERYVDCIVKRYFRLGKTDIKLLREGEEIEYHKLQEWLNG